MYLLVAACGGAVIPPIWRQGHSTMAKARCSIGGCYHFVIYFPGKNAAKKPRRLQRLAKSSPIRNIFVKYTICIQLYQEDQTVLSPIQSDGYRKRAAQGGSFSRLLDTAPVRFYAVKTRCESRQRWLPTDTGRFFIGQSRRCFDAVKTR